MKKLKISEMLKNVPEDQIYLRLQLCEAERAKEQEETRRRTEHELLENTTPQEYCRRRDAQKFLIVEPDVPLDEMTRQTIFVSGTSRQSSNLNCEWEK